MKKVLLTAITLTWAFSGVWADSDWIGPGSDFNTGSNWSAGVPNADIAVFNSASPTTVNLSANVTVTGMTFNPGTAAYTVTVPDSITMTFKKMSGSFAAPNDGIVNNSTNSHSLIVEKGGTLNFLGNTTSSNIVIQNAGTLLFEGVCVLGCFVSTASNAKITNTGLLTFSGFSTAENATIINESTMVVTGPANLPTTLGNATVVNNGLIDASGLNENWSAGSIEGSGNILLGGHDLSFGSNDLNTAISGVIIGTGTLTKVGMGTLTLSGNNTYTGLTTIAGGGINILGSLVSNIYVSTSGTLSGTGHIGQITNAGTVSPGVNGFGDLTTTVYTGSGTLHIQINGSSVPTLNVIGTADITGGTMTVTGSNFALGQYAVLKSNALRGVFEMVNLPDSLFLISPIYTNTDVLLRITFATPFSTLAQTSNQRGLASNLEEFKTTTSQYTQAIASLARLPAEQIPNAFNQISGDSLASFQQVDFQNATVFSQGIRQRVVNVSSGSYGLWAQGMGWSQSIDGNLSVGSPAMHATTGGFQVGYDYSVIDDMVIGFSGGYGQTSVDVLDRSSSGDVTSIHGGLYGGYAQNGWLTTVGTAMTSATNHMTRTIQYGTVSDQATSRFPSRILSSFVETEYAFRPQTSLEVSPALSLRDTRLDQEAFTESGGSGLDLAVDPRSQHSLMSSLGVGLKYSFGPNYSKPGFITVTTAWEHELSENENALSMRFADTEGGGNYTVRATPRDRNSAAIGLHSEIPLKDNLALFAHYTATVGATQTSQSILGGARVTW